MSIAIRCKDLGFECDHVIQAETEEDALSLISEHAEMAHGIEEVSAEMLERVEALIQGKPVEN